ncbi:hypothetical protein PENTCL1PPCAC_2656, partial [Pristionchus entomophagus]
MMARLLLLSFLFSTLINAHINVYNTNCWYVLDRVYENGVSREMTPEEIERLKDYGVQLAEYTVSLTQSVFNLGRDGWPMPPSLPCYCENCVAN